MVITGFEVFGAVTGALGTLKLAGDLFKSLAAILNEWQEAGSKVAQLSRDFNVFKARLEVWSHKIWRIDRKIDDETFAEYWGPEWTVILEQLAAIDRMVLDFAIILSKLLPEATIRKLNNETRQWIRNKRDGVVEGWTDATGLDKRYGLRAIRVEACQWLNQRTSERLSFAQKLEFVFFKSGILDDYLADLNERYTLLRQDAEDFYNAHHPDTARSASLTLRREGSASSWLLKKVSETKVSSEILYWACLDLSRATEADQEQSTTEQGVTEQVNGCPALDLGLLLPPNTKRDSGNSVLQLIYHLIVPWPDNNQQREIVIEGPTSSARNTLPNLANALREIERLRAYAVARTQTHLEFQETLRTDLSLRTEFRLTSPSENTEFNSHKIIKLAELLRQIQRQTSVEAHEQFPQPDRINLAFKVAECGLILLGTSWLSDLKSANIKRLSHANLLREYRFMLESKLTSGQDTLPVEPQTFNIGVLLAEIATGQVVERINTVHTQRGVELDLVMAYLRKGSLEERSFPAATVVSRVNQNMGFTYSKVVDFCLQQSLDCKSREWKTIDELTTWSTRKEAYHEILLDYHSEVYLPLKKMRDFYMVQD